MILYEFLKSIDFRVEIDQGPDKSDTCAAALMKAARSLTVHASQEDPNPNEVSDYMDGFFSGYVLGRLADTEWKV